MVDFFTQSLITYKLFSNADEFNHIYWYISLYILEGRTFYVVVSCRHAVCWCEDCHV